MGSGTTANATAKKMPVLLALCFALAVIVELANSSTFDELFQPSWAPDNSVFEGDLLKLKLDNYSGNHLQEYMSSDGPTHNEFDFEFLGNTTGEPYLVQTNIYVNGEGNREQRLNLWFDPTKEFHTYSALWTQHQVLFLLDETPIRVHTNLEHKGIPYPKDHAIGVYSSIWNADDWATQGGRVKTDWSHAPFIVSYRGFEIDACECPVPSASADNMKKCSSEAENKYWWDEPTVSKLSIHQSHQLMWVRSNHLIYDYCTDTSRFPVTPKECVRHHHDRH
ncbi:hypothetical protein Cgig2_009435 [Carnegiea gigantea]|uniref:Xyloglucan endotransglucosylase/hydrolase n=1 Tax=Carnegiea gigantea TaxID=171969 RepID=A0A9Q1K7E4_9CARY|nr:hypothetical protein Cgig2_009435 [Carnegiea gigantea]